ncbi:MAG: MFS transporter [Chloroflexi bacterium]|nr:MFS transporter [Chloroflexota bacterium]
MNTLWRALCKQVRKRRAAPVADITSPRGASLLRNPLYVRMLSSRAFLAPGRGMDVTVSAWLAIEATDEPIGIAAVGAIRLMPFLIAGLAAGSIADRLPRRRLIQYSQSGTVLFSAAMVALAFLDALPLWALFIYVGCIGFTWAVEAPPWLSYMRGVVGPGNTTRAVALESSVVIGGMVLGGIVTGVVLAFIAPGWVFVMIMALTVISLVSLLNLPVAAPGAEPTVATSRSLMEGIRLVARNRILVMAAALLAVTHMFGATNGPLIPVFAAEHEGLSSARFGLLLSAPLIGSGIGALTIGILGQSIQNPARVLSAAVISYHLMIMLFAIAGFYWIEFFALIAVGITGIAIGNMVVTLLLTHAPDNSHGRMIGIVISISGIVPFAGLAAGYFSSVIGPSQTMLMFAASGLVVSTVVVAAAPRIHRGQIAIAE